MITISLKSKNVLCDKLSFTLVELLIVISIIAILAGILLPSLKTAKDYANQIKCKGNLKQWHGYIMFYSDDNNAWVPPCQSTHDGQIWINFLGRKNYGDYKIDPELAKCPSGHESGWISNKAGNAVLAPLSYSYNQMFGYYSNSGMVKTHQVSKASEHHVMTENTKVYIYFYNGRGNLATYIDRVSDRHNGKANFLYLDGHIMIYSRVKDFNLLYSQGDPHL